MRIFRLEVNIDGFGGKLRDSYFYSFEDAFNALTKTSGFFYNKEEKKWNIQGIKETRVSMKEGEELSILGIIYSEYEWDEYCLRWARASIESIDVDGAPLNNRVYLLCKKYGYNSWMNESIESNFMPNDLDPIFKRYDPILLSFSKNYIRKYARSHVKSLPRIWNNKEYDREINTITGNGRDYLSIMEYEIA